jgi:hypothetical protein
MPARASATAPAIKVGRKNAMPIGELHDRRCTGDGIAFMMSPLVFIAVVNRLTCADEAPGKRGPGKNQEQ